MKKIILLCVCALGVLTACVQQKVSSFSSVSQQIASQKNAMVTFDDTAYLFVYGTPTLNEYVPKGEDISNWRNLIAIELFPEYATAAQAAGAMMTQLQEEEMPYQVLENKAMGMSAVYYELKTSKDVELNVWKFEKPAKWRGVIAYRMAKKFPVGSADDKQYYVNQFLRTRSFNFIH